MDISAQEFGSFERLGPLNNDILCFDFGSKNNADTIYVGSRENGIYKTTDGAESWEQINNGIPDNFVRSISVNPTNTSTILAGTFSNGLFISQNEGSSWAPINEVDDQLILDISFDSNNGDTVYVATFTKGVFRSWNGGLNWEHLTPNFQEPVLKIIVDPNFSNNIYFASRMNVFKSSDFGSSWDTFYIDPSNHIVRSLTIEKGNSNTIWIGTGQGTTGALRKTNDGGENWSLMNSIDEVITRILIDPNNVNIVYASTVSDGIFKSENGGDDWQSIDNGGNWIQIPEMKFSPTTSLEIYASSNEFGLLRTTTEDISSSLSQAKTKGEIRITNYPNPFSETTRVEYNIPVDERKENTRLFIYNNFGKTIKSIELEFTGSEDNAIIINRELLSSGIYYLGINCKSDIYTNKIIVVD